MAGDLEKLAVDIERPVGCISRVVFWILFVVYSAVLGVVGWLVYNYILVSHPIPLSPNHKDALIVILSVVVLGVMLAAITRDYIRNRIYNRVDRKRSRN
jgi:H+/Cl- antiporter ClcA